jgi:probable non-F420 flavinoid oxidoreductase
VTVIGFHASHEQVDPRTLLGAVQHAEQVGFTAAMCSDHIFPWSSRQGESGFAWSWLGAALQATSLPLGVVNAPGQRYHPAIIAQAAMTLQTMFPGRFWAALGSGQYMNEHITGEGWPAKEDRNARLLESVHVMRRLFAGETVSHRGHVRVDRAKLFTRDATGAAPALLAAAITPATAGWAAQWADGLITVNADHDTLRRVTGAYRDAGGTGPLCLQVHISWAEDDEEAAAIAYDQWRTNVFSSQVLSEIATEAQFDDLGTKVQPHEVDGPVRISADPARHAQWVAEYADLGFDRIFLHHVGKEQRRWLDVFGERVLPQLDVTRPGDVSVTAFGVGG